MAAGAEILAIKNGDLGSWLFSIGLPDMKETMEDMGADTPHDLLFLDSDDIESVTTDAGEKATLLAAIARIERIESDDAPEEVASISANVEHDHGHLLQIHRQEIEQERHARSVAENRAEAESSARVAAERRAMELEDAVAKMSAKQELLGTETAARMSAESRSQQLALALRTAEAAVAEAAAAQSSAAAVGGGAAARSSEALAVIGMGCRLPSGSSPGQVWATLEAGRDCVAVGPRGRWDVEQFFDPDDSVPGKCYSKWGGFIDDVDHFEPTFFNISQRECKSMDPQQRIFMEVAWEALEDAAVVPGSLKHEPVGVYLGIQNYDYFRLLGTAGHLDELDAYFGTGQSHSCAVGRLSFFLGLKGASIPVDTACSSSLVATQLATEGLRSGDCSAAFVGGVNLMLAPEINVNLAKAHMLSPDGRCHTYDASANGYVRGEGCGVVYLKPLSAAEADHDNVHALVIGAAVNHDGSSSGLTVPSGPAQQMVIRSAQKNGNITPDDVSCIESHGTGTKLGDPIEIGAITSVFSGRQEPLVIGTVKTVVGHLESAAGIAGMTKAVMSLERGSIPAHLHLKTLNPHISFNGVPIEIPNVLTPWPSAAKRRITGCSAFGFGGTNGHVMLESPPVARPADPSTRQWQLFSVSAKTQASLASYARKIGSFLADDMSHNLADVCFTSMACRTQFAQSFAVAVDSTHMLQEELANFADASSGYAERARSTSEEKVAFVFDDDGEQYVGMGQELYRTESVFQEAIDACDKVLAKKLGSSLNSVLYGSARVNMKDAKIAQPVTFALEYALAQLWLSWGLKPAVVVGCGVGEYVAACVAGVFSLEHALQMVTARGALTGKSNMTQMYSMATKMVAFSKPQIAVVTSTGKLVTPTDDVVSTASYWQQEPLASIAFESAMSAAIAHGATRFVEIGPVCSMASTGARCIAQSEHAVWVSSLVRGKTDSKCLVEGAATLITAGVQANWSAVCAYDPASQCKVAFPTYAFDRKKFWIDRDVYDQSTASATLGSKITPLLGANVESALSQQIYQTEFSTKNLPLLGDHVLHGVVVVPGAAYLSMGLSAAVDMYRNGPHRLHSVTFPQALVLPDAETGRRVQLIFDSKDTDSSFSLHSFDESTKMWVEHMTGSLTVSPHDAPTPKLPAGYFEEVKARCTAGDMPCGEDPWCEELYKILWDREYHLRTAFRWLGHIWRGDREALCKMRMPLGSHEWDDFQLFPGLIDSCFQLLASTAFDEFKGTTFIPMWCDAYNFFGKPAKGTQLYCHAVERENNKYATKDAMGADIWLFDSAGNKVVELINIRMKKAGVEALIHGAPKQTNNQFYGVDWKSKAAGPEPADMASWLVVGGDGADVDSLTRDLQDRKHRVIRVAFGSSYSKMSNDSFCVDPADPSHFTRLIDSIDATTAVVHAGASSGLAGVDPVAALTPSCQSALFLTQAMVAASWSSRLYYVTLEAQQVGSSTLHDANSATLWGLGRVVALEHPNLKCTIIDLEAGANWAATLAHELACFDGEQQVAYRGGRRLAARLAKTPLPVTDGGLDPVVLRVDGRGVLDNLFFQQAERQTPGAGQVEIRVAVTGLNFRDVMNAMGMYPNAEELNMPFGGECAGYIESVGPGVVDFSVGDQVFGIAPGSFSTFAISDTNYLVKKPAGISFQEAVTIPATFLTAWYGLVHLANIAAGQKVLVHAASGGVGLAAVQVCKGFNCEIFGTAKPGEKQEFLKSVGVKHVMSSRDTSYGAGIAAATNGRGVNVVLNSLSGEGMIETSLKSLAQGGHFVEIGKAGIWSKEQVRALRPDVTFHHFDLVQIWDDDPPFIKAMLADLMAKFARKEIQTLPVHSFPQAKTIDAFRFMANAKHIGKIVVTWDPPVKEVTFSDAGSYIVTGGLSGVGLLTAKWMLSKGAKHLILASRSGATAGNAAARAELEAAGAVITVPSVDVSNLEAVKTLVGNCTKSATPLRGIIHSAGVVDDQLLTDVTWDRFVRAMAPKLNGTWNLHKATENIEMDCFTMYSTMSAVVGNVGQSNYAAGNAFMDALAQLRSSSGLPALSVNWGPWAEVGMASRMDPAALKMIPEAAMITPTEGMELLSIMMSQTKAQVAVVASTFLQTFASSSTLMVDLMKEAKPAAKKKAPSGGAAGAGGTALSTTLATAPETQRQTLLVEFISGEVAKILALDSAADVDPSQPLTEMGLDSLMAVELRNALADAVGQPLAATLLFDYPMVIAIAEYLLKDVLELEDVQVSSQTKAAAKPRKERTESRLAIVGMSCRFPAGANTVESFWENLSEGKDCIDIIPKLRWDWQEYYAADKDAPGKTYSKWGGFLDEDADLFDPFFFSVVPKEACGMDPQQRKLMEVSWETMERAGIHLEPSRGSPVGVFVGICSNDYQMLQTATGNKGLCDAYYGTGNANSVAGGRIAYVMGFQGPTVSVDTACSSSVVAVHMGCQAIQLDECEMALCGGVNMLITPDLSINFSKAHMLSPNGRCFTFDSRANGYVRGEGCGMLLLKPMSDAQDGGDNVVATLRGSAINQDGRSSGITAPNGPSQQNCMRFALAKAGVAPASVGYVEAHGTGTPLGDPIEVDALAAVMAEGRPDGESYYLGSVKTNIGHLEGAAGASGLCKLILTVQNAALPAHLNFKQANPHLDLERAGAVVPLEKTAWTGAAPRIGGVSSFGFSGTNGHVVVEESPAAPARTSTADRNGHIFTMSAKTDKALIDLAKRYVDHFSAHGDVDIADVCYTASTGRANLAHRLSASVTSVSELRTKLASFVAGDADAMSRGFVEEKVAPKVVFVFTGHPSQLSGISRELYDTQPLFREKLDECAAAVKSLFGADLLSQLFSDATPEDAALFALQYSLAQLWISWGVMPAVVTGYGVNEYVAACVAGVFSLEDGLKMAVADAGTQLNSVTASVQASPDQLSATLRRFPDVFVVAHNAPATVISGSQSAVAAAASALQGAGYQCKVNAAPFAAPDTQKTKLQAIAAAVQYSQPRIPVVPAASGKVASQNTLTAASYWVDRPSQGAQFAGPVAALVADKYSVFVEIGPTSAGTHVGQQLQGIQPALWLPSMGQGLTSVPTIFESVSQLFVRGGHLDFAQFDASFSRRKVVLPTYAYQRERYWVSGLSGSVREVAKNVADSHLANAVEYGLSKPINKLLGRQINTPWASESIFLSHFSVEEGCLPVINDHIINGFLIVPAVFDVGTVLEAHNYILGPGSRVLEGVTIPAALVLNDIASKPVQLIVSQTSDTELDWQLVSYKSGPPEDEDSWLGNASGKMRVDNTRTSRINETIEAIKARCDVEQTKQDFYTYMYGNEYELGGGPGGNCLGTWHGEGTGKGDGEGKWDLNSPDHGKDGHGFQLVNHIWRNGSEALCELVVESSKVTKGYQLYPVYFDCCIQIIASIVSSLPGAGGVSYVPIAIEKFILHKTPEDGVPLYCHTKLQGDGNFLESETIGAMMCVMGADGDIFAEAINFRVKKAGKEALAAALKEDLSSYYYNLEWEMQPLADPVKRDATGSWLVFADSAASAGVVSQLKADGNEVVVVQPGSSFSIGNSKATVRPDNSDDYVALLSSDSWNHSACVGVVHMWSMDNATDADPTPAGIEAATRVGTHSLLYLTQAVAKMGATPKMWIMTRGTQATGSESSGLAVSQSPAWGFGKVLALEMRKTECVRIDMGLGSPASEAQQILGELTNETGEQEIAFRGDDRKIARLVQRKKDSPGSLKLSAEGNYLITGGFGALGLIVAKMLVQRGARHLILMSRRGAPDSAADALQELKDMGAVLTPGTADVSNAAQLASIFSSAERSGHPVVGVVHSAGVIDDKMIGDLDWASFERVMAAKVAGACNLNAHMKKTSDEFFVLFSSATSAIGNVGQANYAAANAFLDSLAHHRMAKGLPGLSINWGPWADIGMAAGIDAGAFESTGLGLLKPSKGLDIMEQCMVQSSSAQIVVAPVTWPTYLGRMGKSVPALFATMAADQEKAAGGSKKKAKKSSGGGSEASAALIKRLTAVPESKRIPVLSAMIQKSVMEVLGVTDPSAVGMKQALSELGMDSLMAVDVQNVLAEMVGATLPGTLLFDYPTIDSIANYLLDEVLELTEEEEGGGALSDDVLNKMRNEPIAISGMSARMPGGGDNPEMFWSTLASGTINTRAVPESRWDHSVVYDPDPDAPGKAYTDQGGFLTFDISEFDAAFFGISNREAEHMDPQQRMLLEVSWEAIESAGISADTLVNSRTGVNLGICGYDYCLLGTRTNDLAGIVGYTGTGVAWSVAAGRISYTFGFKGPAFTVDTACSSGLLATHMACNDLKHGVTNYAVAGGVNLLLAPDLYVNFSKARMLSPNGRCATFDESADGFCRAEGCSMLLLRRLSEAEQAGDRIQALLRGTATNQDGRSNSLTAPNGPSQQAVINESLTTGAIEPAQVSYLECHGTGTSLGDPIEVIAAANVLSKGRSKEAPLILGSVKACSGHLEGAAGSSGLTKIIMCMKYEQIPTQVHFKTLNDVRDSPPPLTPTIS